MSNVHKVVSAAVSQTGATFYTLEGEVKTVHNTNPRVIALVEQVLAMKAQGHEFVLIDLDSYSVFKEIEQNSGGILRFFRVAKKMVQRVLGSRAERASDLREGGFESAPAPEEPQKVQPGTEPVTPEITKALEAAERTTSRNGTKEEDTTVIAVVGDTPIVGAEALQPHAEAAVNMGQPIGFQNLMKRLGAVAAERKHTVQEALEFLKEMDLPFANDGCILAYKSLTKTHKEGVFRDNHTGKLEQGLGTFVQMQAELVDDNRRVACSNGLHVARRGYLGGYGAGHNNVITLIKIAPEDVISVPMYEKSKMRVRAYHIVAVLSDDDMKAISAQKSFTAENMEKASLLAKVIRGDHVPVLNITTEHAKGKVDQMVPVENPVKPEIIGEEIEQAQTVEKAQTSAVKVDVAKVNKKLAESEAPLKPKEPKAKLSEVETLYRKWRKASSQRNWDALIDFQQKSGKSFKALGLSAEDVQLITVELNLRKKAALSKERKKNKVKPIKQKAPTGVNKTRQAFNAWKANPTPEALEVLRVAKKTAKKGWDALGFSPLEQAEIKGKLGL